MALLSAEEAQTITETALIRIAAENAAKYQATLDKYDPKIRDAADKGIRQLTVPVLPADADPIAALLRDLGYTTFYNSVSSSLTIKW